MRIHSGSDRELIQAIACTNRKSMGQGWGLKKSIFAFVLGSALFVPLGVWADERSPEVPSACHRILQAISQSSLYHAVFKAQYLPGLNKPVSALRQGMKAVFYPFVGTARIAAALSKGVLGRDARLALAHFKRGVKDDAWHMAVFVALGLFSQSATLSDHELSQAGHLPVSEGTTLVVNAFNRDEYLFEAIHRKSLSEQAENPQHRYLDYRDVFPSGIVRREENRTYWEMTWLAIERTVAERGQKLSHIVFQSHGLPGLICLYGENGELASAQCLNGIKPQDIFAPGAVIEFRACSVGASFGGRLLAADLAKHYLRGGGQVVLSNVTIVRDYPETIYFQLGFPVEAAPSELNGITRFYLAGWSAVQYVIFSVAAEAPAPVRFPHDRVSVFEFPAHP